jgi:hypothetical protein
MSATRRLLAGIASVAVLSLSNPVVSDSWAQSANSSSTADPRLALVTVSPSVTAGASYRIVVDANRIPSADSNWEIATTVRPPVSSEQQLVDAFAGQASGPVVDIRRFGVARSGRQVIDLPLGACAECIPVSRLGVYPVDVELRRPGATEVADRFTVAMQVTAIADAITTDTPDERLGVALVVPLHIRPTMQPDGSEANVDFRSVVETTEAIARHPSLRITVAPTPSTIDMLRRNQGGGVLDTLRSALPGRTVLNSPYVRIRRDLLESPSLGPEIVRQLDLSVEVLRSLDVEPVSGVYIHSSGAVPSLAALGRLQTQQVLIGSNSVRIASDATASEPDDDQKPPVDRFVALDVDPRAEDASALPAVVVDSDLASSLRPVGRRNDARLGAVQLSARLALRAEQVDGAKRVAIVVPDDFSAGLNTLLDTLAAMPGIETVELDDFFNAVSDNGVDDLVVVEPITSNRTSSISAASAETASAVAQASRRLSGAALMLDDDAPLLSARERLSFAVADSAPDGTEPDQYVSAVERLITPELGTVALVRGGSYRLTAREGSIPVTLRSEGKGRRTVRVVVSSDRLEFTNGFTPLPNVGAGSVAYSDVVIDGRATSVRIPIRARTSGSFRFLVRVTTPQGSGPELPVELSSSSYVVRSTAVSGVGVTLSVLSGAVLALWWIRHTRNSRRDRRKLARADHPANPDRAGL